PRPRGHPDAIDIEFACPAVQADVHDGLTGSGRDRQVASHPGPVERTGPGTEMRFADVLPIGVEKVSDEGWLFPCFLTVAKLCAPDPEPHPECGDLAAVHSHSLNALG